jgi:NAD(P)-dependent dehydrogenase (short-subunit alcohol dehydrogenase family)
VLLKDKVAIVTGGAKGIGRGICLKFASEGCSVAVTDLNLESAREVADEIKATGGKALAIGADVSDIARVKNAVTQTVKKFGKVDILVNNAGGVFAIKGGPIETTTEDDWNTIININLKGQFFFCQAVVPYMKKQKYGKIVNVSSMGAIHPPAPIVHYHSAKGGVLGLTTNLAYELAPFNITVNALLPGPIFSEFYTNMLKDMTEKERKAFFKMLAGRVPMQRVGTPEDMAGVALFLASDLSSYVTGEAICAGGGLPLTPQD